MPADTTTPTAPRSAPAAVELAARPRRPPRDRRGMGDARRADRDRRHRRPRAPHRIGPRLPDVAAVHRRLARRDARDGHPRHHRVRQPHADLRARRRRDRDVPVRGADAPRSAATCSGCRSRSACTSRCRRSSAASRCSRTSTRTSSACTSSPRSCWSPSRRCSWSASTRLPDRGCSPCRAGTPSRPIVTSASQCSSRSSSASSSPARVRTPATAARRATAWTPEFMQHVHSWPAYVTARPHARDLRRRRGALPRRCGCRCGPASCSRSRSSRSSSASGRRAPGCRSLLVNIHMVLAVLARRGDDRRRHAPEGAGIRSRPIRLGRRHASHSNSSVAHTIDTEPAARLSDAASCGALTSRSSHP